MKIRLMRPSDLDAVVALVVARQADPVHHIGYLDAEPQAVASQLATLEPDGIGGHLVAVEEADDGALLGFLGLDWDNEPPRVWWHGPVIADVNQWDVVADALYVAGLARLPATVTEQELFHDARSGLLAGFAARHGFTREPGSAVLERSLTDIPSVPVAEDVSIAPLAPTDRQAIATLHDTTFPGAHVPGHRLSAGERRRVLVARRGTTVIGYVAVERQLDDEGYIDFLAVTAAQRGAGIGAALVAAALGWCRERGCTGVHLTVREQNGTARALYDRLDFIETMIAIPWRTGTTMAGH